VQTIGTVFMIAHGVEYFFGAGRGLVLGLILMALLPSALRTGGARFHPLDPETAIPLAYFLSAAYSPTVRLFFAPDFTLHEYEVVPLEVALVGSVGCAIVCTLKSRPSERIAGAADDISPPQLSFLDGAVIITGLTGAAMVLAHIGHVGVNRLVGMSYGETYIAEDGFGVLTAGWYVIQLAAAYLLSRCLAFGRARARIPRVLLAALALLALSFLWNTILGRRGPLVWLIASLVIVAHTNNVLLRRAWFLVGLVALALYAFAIEGMRANLDKDIESRSASALARLETLNNPAIIPELDAVWANLVVMVREQPALVSYPGESISNALLLQVPKAIWPDRPLGFAQRYVRWADPALARAGGGLAFSATAEGYLNAGSLGAALEVALMTLIAFVPWADCMRRPRSSMHNALAACLGAYSYFHYRSELGAVVKYLVTLAAAVLLISVLQAVLCAVQGRYEAAAGITAAEQ
jgi:hypothetical protein